MAGEPSVPSWVPLGLRYVIAGLVGLPAVGKFLRYDRSVAMFTDLGLPSPELTVLLVGAIEAIAVVLLLVDVLPWAASIGLLPIVAVAFWKTGEWQALAVLLGALAIVVVELGPVGVDPPPDSPDDAAPEG